MISAAIVTMTLARSPEDEALLTESLMAAASLGYPLAIADRSGRPEFLARLARLPRCTVAVASGSGLVGQVQTAFSVAASFNTEFLFYTEPDKAAFFRDGANRLLRAVEHTPHAGLILASRSAESFQTFPPMQRYTEGIVNHLCGDLAHPGDYCYGPFVLHRRLLPHIQSIPAGLGWGWRLSTFRAALRQSLPLIHAVDDLPCPPDQCEENDDDRAHRLRQLSQNLLGLID